MITKIFRREISSSTNIEINTKKKLVNILGMINREKNDVFSNFRNYSDMFKPNYDLNIYKILPTLLRCLNFNMKDRDTLIDSPQASDKINWTEHGDVLQRVNGSDWEGDWVGTPVVWEEDGQWYMLYEGGLPGDVGLALSDDGVNWTRHPDNPVFPEGVGWEDRITAADSIIKLNGIYYMFYHARGSIWQTGYADS